MLAQEPTSTPVTLMLQIYEEEFANVRGHFGPINAVSFSPGARLRTCTGPHAYTCGCMGTCMHMYTCT